MSIFQRILVAIDDEGLATGAIARGLELADAFASDLRFVHAVEVPAAQWPNVDEATLAALHADALARSREAALEILHRLQRDSSFGERAVEDLLEVRPGHAAEVILRAASDHASDLLLLGPHASRSVFDFGSTARALLSKAPIPVWTEVGAVDPVKRILVPLDFSEHSRRALDTARELAERTRASITLLHCHAAPLPIQGDVAEAGTDDVVEAGLELARQELARWVEEYDGRSVPCGSALAEGTAHERILEHAADHDLVVMGTHGRTGLSRFVLGSTAYSVLKSAEQAVLVVPDVERSWLLGSPRAADAGVRVSFG